MHLKVINNKGQELLIILSEHKMDAIINILYPPAIQDNSKGYIELVNHIYGKRNE